MLRLVAAGKRAVPAAEPCVALWGLDPELAAYVEGCLQARWPGLAVVRVDAASPPGQIAAALWICARRPPADMPAPALWLGEVDRSEQPTRLAARLWACSMPITGRKLVRSVALIRGLADD